MELSDYAIGVEGDLDRRHFRPLAFRGKGANFAGNLGGHNADLKTMNVRRDPGQPWGKAQQKSVLQNRAMPGLVTEVQPVGCNIYVACSESNRFL
jgi:hypothetical protein